MNEVTVSASPLAPIQNMQTSLEILSDALKKVREKKENYRETLQDNISEQAEAEIQMISDALMEMFKKTSGILSKQSVAFEWLTEMERKGLRK